MLCLDCAPYNKENIDGEILKNLKILMNNHIDTLEKKVDCNYLIVINN